VTPSPEGDRAADLVARRAYPRARPAAPGETRRYRLVDRDAQRSVSCAPPVVEVVVDAACPDCGSARPEPRDTEVVDHYSGAKLRISRWTATCAHILLHADLIREARSRRATA
jgi:hypothetical protein